MGSASVFLEPISCFYIAGIDPDAKHHLTLLVTRTRSGWEVAGTGCSKQLFRSKEKRTFS